MKIKPCWCGNKDIEITHGEWLDEPNRVIKCDKCGLTIMRLVRMRPKKAEREVVEAWNERPYYEKRTRGSTG